MIAFHGSPCLFDRFDASKLGSVCKHTGSEGSGMYVANSRYVASCYSAPPPYSTGFLYEVEAPDGVYIDNDKLCAEQPEPVRTLMLEAIERLTLSGPMSGYRKFRIDNAPTTPDVPSQVGQVLYYARKSGNSLEPVLAAQGYVGCMKRQEERGGYVEFAVFEPSVLRILSVAEHKERIAA